MKNYLKDFKSFGLNEGFGWGSMAGGLAAASRRNRPSSHGSYSRRSHYRTEEEPMEKPEFTLHDVSKEMFGCEFWELESDRDKKECLREYTRRSQANESEMYDEDDYFMDDLDQAEDGIITLDSLAMDEFGMPYDQLGPGEKEWCNDEYDKLA